MSLTAELLTVFEVFALAFVVRLLVTGVTDVPYSVGSGSIASARSAA